MKNCFITKLKGNVENENIPFLGEFFIQTTDIKEDDIKFRGLTLTFNKPSEVRIVGDGYFTNSENENNGKSKNVAENVRTEMFLSKGEYKVGIKNKYNLTLISFIADSKPSNETKTNKAINIDDLKFCRLLNSITIIGENVTGDLSSLKDLTLFTYINLGSTNITGDLSSLKDLTLLTSLNLGDTNITGDLSSLKDLTLLTSLYLRSTNITGDIALMQDGFNYISCFGTTLSWSNRPSNMKRFSIYGDPTIDNIDKMLQDMAACSDNVGDTNKIISATGTRTSSSDAAVQTLQSKGYTVSIIPA